jgi:hypothetical protein
MPRLQIVRLPQDHTSGPRWENGRPRRWWPTTTWPSGAWWRRSAASRFWPKTVVFVVEDDAQSGPDHVDAHRTEALVAGPFVRRGAVDSTPYTTCSMLRTIELILGLEPMSQFDAAAAPMRASFQPHARPVAVQRGGRSRRHRAQEREQERRRGDLRRFDLSREDLIDEQVFNRVIWAAVRGDDARMPGPCTRHLSASFRAADDDD